jgi:hypothetical protein
MKEMAEAVGINVVLVTVSPVENESEDELDSEA